MDVVGIKKPIAGLLSLTYIVDTSGVTRVQASRAETGEIMPHSRIPLRSMTQASLSTATRSLLLRATGLSLIYVILNNKTSCPLVPKDNSQIIILWILCFSTGCG